MQFLSTVLAVICITFSTTTMATPTPQGFIGQEKCTNVVCNGAGKWVTAAYCGSNQHCGIVGGEPHCI
ncbi:hypothetical protein BKA64DRAFT_709299 [Cadophora sp. MPI-SDFR-AT-0126]|nr:hypothetical protein BKA64DRAFT_709299 [Leotiomycetes sp. MPI-SDFR-AT-0126]